MHILVVGSGGREHALAWKLAQSANVSAISVAPGNAGIADEPKTQCIPIANDDHTALIDFACQQNVDLTIVGPEAPLVAGIVDNFQAAGLRILGPTAAAARLEGSKAYAKEFMQRHNIPTARYAIFSNVTAAAAYIDRQTLPIVIKADGLAAGKGVVVAHSYTDAHTAIHVMLADQKFGEAGSTVVIEEFLAGEEVSFIALVDGQQCLPFATSQDHKARDDGDSGPNTGGMGAYSPAPVVSHTIHQHIVKDILQPTVDALVTDDTPFTGFLYIGLMINKQGQAKVIEYNVRLGDPETQPILMRMDSDLAELCAAAVDGDLHSCTTQWKKATALGVVLAGGNYPESGSHGEVICNINQAEQSGCKVFHAGTKRIDENFVTNGGRILCVTALGDSILDAKLNADQGADTIHWQHMHYRRDIGYRAISRLQTTEPA